MRSLLLLLVLFFSSLSSAQVFEVEGEEGLTLYAPTAITPDNDGINDCWYVEHYGGWEEFDIKVYNKWGVQVWGTTDPEDCWIGNVTVKDRDGLFYVQNEMYFYKIFARRGTMVKDYIGTVTVIR